MEYRILGPLEVVDGTSSVRLGGGKQRALLAALLLNAGRVVSRDRLSEDLWGDACRTARRRWSRSTSRASARCYPSRRSRRAVPATPQPRRGLPDLDRFLELRADGRAAPKAATTRRHRACSARRFSWRVRHWPSSRRRSRMSRPFASMSFGLHARGPDRGPSRARPARRRRRRARDARCALPAPRAPARPAHPGALRVRPPGGRAGGMPGCAARARRRARHRAVADAERPRAPRPPAGPDTGAVSPGCPERHRCGRCCRLTDATGRRTRTRARRPAHLPRRRGIGPASSRVRRR